ncbi:uncharacterized protein LOC132721930 [Ruditapes philippinarum]|uniref:uncharacterized protein LOC132721930 n=1 Tax=Ruditapes philippinarum TaxID=129788 RepID=UPI00295BF98C|nr:uncharacterized protein LOC132721930 [Ruditapes philippinarum]XP_060562297.1 uncharacterized protein LOC132721930 [Ruditapes philippinarum]
MYQHLYTETKNPDCERDRSVKEKRNNQSNKVAVSVLEPNTEQTEYDTNTYEIPDQNVYEGLDRQDNALSGETYQHLYTETQNLDCEIKTQNLSHRQSDTNSLEKEHNNTHDSICDGIHHEYEFYKANATDHMYETLQKDK